MPVSDARPRNRLLAALPESEFATLRADLDVVTFNPKDVVHQQGEQFQFVYFPNSGVYSMTIGLSNGARVESATVGSEGMVGIGAFLNEVPISPSETLLQVPGGDTHRLPVTAFRRELARRGALQELVGRYAEAVLAHTMQSAACNAQHVVQERCAGWLLMTHDRVGTDQFELSHEFLATMLGVTRQSVTVVAGTLQAAGLIRYQHAQITILDRKGLEAASCECYAMVRDTYDRLLPNDRPGSDVGASLDVRVADRRLTTTEASVRKARSPNAAADD